MTKAPAPRSANPNAAKRSSARLAAVQALYSMEITGVSAQQALDEFRARQAEQRSRLAEPNGELLSLLVVGTAAETEQLDEIIRRALARDWTVDRLEAVLRAILRAGTYEIQSRPQTPARVAISEYVDVAHAFYSGPEPGLVNAVLDRVCRELRPDEFK